MTMTNRLELRHIVCPIDFSGEFKPSLAYASAIARAHAGELRALHVIPGEGAAVPHEVGFLRRETLMQRLRELCSKPIPLTISSEPPSGRETPVRRFCAMPGLAG